MPVTTKIISLYDPIYDIIASRITDEPTLAYALDLYDVIERGRKLRNKQITEGLKSEALATENTRNDHITTLSKLMSTHALTS
jgi:hypothetical protein